MFSWDLVSLCSKQVPSERIRIYSDAILPQVLQSIASAAKAAVAVVPGEFELGESRSVWNTSLKNLHSVWVACHLNVCLSKGKSASQV